MEACATIDVIIDGLRRVNNFDISENACRFTLLSLDIQDKGGAKGAIFDYQTFCLVASLTERIQELEENLMIPSIDDGANMDSEALELKIIKARGLFYLVIVHKLCLDSVVCKECRRTIKCVYIYIYIYTHGVHSSSRQ